MPRAQQGASDDAPHSPPGRTSLGGRYLTAPILWSFPLEFGLSMPINDHRWEPSMSRGSQGTGGFNSGTCLSRQRGTGKPTEAVPSQSATVPEVPVLGSQTPTSSLDRLVHVHSFETCHPWMMDRNFGRFFEVDFALGHRGAGTHVPATLRVAHCREGRSKARGRKKSYGIS